MILMLFINQQFYFYNIYGLSALHIAALVNDANMIDMLIQYKANINIAGGEGIFYFIYFMKLPFILLHYMVVLMLFIDFMLMVLILMHMLMETIQRLRLIMLYYVITKILLHFSFIKVLKGNFLIFRMFHIVKK